MVLWKRSYILILPVSGFINSMIILEDGLKIPAEFGNFYCGSEQVEKNLELRSLDKSSMIFLMWSSDLSEVFPILI